MLKSYRHIGDYEKEIIEEFNNGKVEEIDNFLHIYCCLKRKPHKCPHCNAITDTIHDYRMQVIKDIPAFGKKCVIHLKK